MTSVETVKVAHEDGVITFFGFSTKIEGGRYHCRMPGSSMFQRAGIASYMDDVRGSIQDDVDAGRADEIAQLHLSDALATVMVLDGRIPVEALANAIESDIYVDIPGVTIEGISMTIRVFEYGSHPTFGDRFLVATADADGNVIM